MKYSISLKTNKTPPPAKTSYSSFVSHGIACHCLSFLDASGVLESCLINGHLRRNEAYRRTDPALRIVVDHALQACSNAGVFEDNGDTLTLTPLGHDLVDHIGLVSMLFSGYGRLMCEQTLHGNKPLRHPEQFIDGASIARASIQFGSLTIDPLIENLLARLAPNGDLCDLGSGAGYRLVRLCNARNIGGIGFEVDEDAIHLSLRITNSNPNVKIYQGDVTAIRGIWPSVEVLMQCFVLHDIASDFEFVRVMRSYRSAFPNCKYFVFADIMCPDASHPNHMPGYDYVHSLQAIPTRTYQHTRQLIEKAGYRVIEENAIDLPNTFVWLLAMQ